MLAPTLLPLILSVLPLSTAIPAPAPAALAAPPNIPSTSAARSALNGLTVAPEGPQEGYSRSLFRHWITISGECNTREEVLKRDGQSVTVDSRCYPSSGSWFSEYDGETVSVASGVDIDHVIPLSNAWKSGAASWTAARRQEFANDLTNPQLIAVTARSNRAKGDKGPENWKPPRTSYHCTYAKMWVKVKSTYSLSVNEAEKAALTEMLGTC
ncbi:hypothetical protein LOZ58_005332 [Ophidiomyces ophidiicola]|nr:hypothetical protein LOZ65_004138 [Ophidiomyces ophidiicola]KAI1958217.1 hypothetical protein LOZ58_005332 [Ophidiomyces ophidiicola]